MSRQSPLRWHTKAEVQGHAHVVTVSRDSDQFGTVVCGVMYLSEADAADFERRLADDDD